MKKSPGWRAAGAFVIIVLHTEGREIQMAPIVHSVEIDRSPEDVFAYVTDPAKFTEWQEGVVSAHQENPETPIGTGSRALITRKVGGREQTMTGELREYDPPRSYAFRVLDGPVRAHGRSTLEPLDGGARTRLTIEIDFDGHGIGTLLVPLLVRRQAAREVPRDHANLKHQLEATQT
jgi:uncharacterized protein YndB with AHSA1/START domain